MLGAAAVVFDHQKRLLLTQRTDNEQWCLPGGRLDAGEDLMETCLRELAEETGIEGAIERLVGIYSSPDLVAVYADGLRRQVVAAVFEVAPSPGARLMPDPNEVMSARYVTRAEAQELDVVELHRQRITDAFSAESRVFLR